MRLESDEIIKLLDCLIGRTEAIGETNADEQIEKNLMTLIDVTNWCIDGVAQSSETRHRYEGSMRRVGERAFGALCEWGDWVNARCEE